MRRRHWEKGAQGEEDKEGTVRGGGGGGGKGGTRESDKARAEQCEDVMERGKKKGGERWMERGRRGERVS